MGFIPLAMCAIAGLRRSGGGFEGTGRPRSVGGRGGGGVFLVGDGVQPVDDLVVVAPSLMAWWTMSRFGSVGAGAGHEVHQGGGDPEGGGGGDGVDVDVAGEPFRA